MSQYQHDGECILIRKMRGILTENNSEVCLAGKVTRDNGGELSLSFPTGVYGFSVELAEGDKKELFEEAEAKGLSRLDDVSKFKPICGTSQYPLYWGLDGSIGKRLHDHLVGCDKQKKTGSVRLNMYDSLRGKEIYCAVVIVKDKDTARQVENLLKEKFPDLLKTKIITNET